MNPYRTSENIRAQRREVIALILAAVLLASGVGIASSAATSLMSDRGLWWSIVGSALAILVIGTLVVRVLVVSDLTLMGTAKIRLLVHRKNEDVDFAVVNEYSPSHNASLATWSLLAEQPALKEWLLDESSPNVMEDQQAYKFCCHLIQYLIADCLAIFNSDYFERNDISSKRIAYADLPTDLRGNLFLDVFTTPLERRLPVDSRDDTRVAKVTRGEDVLRILAGPHRFEKHEVVVPEDATVTAVESCNGVVPAMHIGARGASVVVDFAFSGWSNWSDSSGEYRPFLSPDIRHLPKQQSRPFRECTFNVHVHAKLSGIFALRHQFDWRYDWIEALIERIRQALDWDVFTARVPLGMLYEIRSALSRRSDSTDPPKKEG